MRSSDLLTSGGRDGQPLAVATVTHLHAVLRKAFRDAVIVDELIGSNPVERAKRPRAQAQEPGTVWTIAQLRAFLATARQHRLSAFFHIAAYTGARRGELLNLRWQDIDLDDRKITITGSTAVIGGERVNGTTKSGRIRVVSIDDETSYRTYVCTTCGICTRQPCCSQASRSTSSLLASATPTRLSPFASTRT